MSLVLPAEQNAAAGIAGLAAATSMGSAPMFAPRSFNGIFSTSYQPPPSLPASLSASNSMPPDLAGFVPAPDRIARYPAITACYTAVNRLDGDYPATQLREGLPVFTFKTNLAQNSQISVKSLEKLETPATLFTLEMINRFIREMHGKALTRLRASTAILGGVRQPLTAANYNAAFTTAFGIANEFNDIAEQMDIYNKTQGAQADVPSSNKPLLLAFYTDPRAILRRIAHLGPIVNQPDPLHTQPSGAQERIVSQKSATGNVATITVAYGYDSSIRNVWGADARRPGMSLWFVMKPHTVNTPNKDKLFGVPLFTPVVTVGNQMPFADMHYTLPNGSTAFVPPVFVGRTIGEHQGDYGHDKPVMPLIGSIFDNAEGALQVSGLAESQNPNDALKKMQMLPLLQVCTTTLPYPTY